MSTPCELRCPTCGEPWEYTVLRDEVVQDLDVPFAQIAEFKGRMSNEIQKALEAEGWLFAVKGDIFSFLACNCCKSNSRLTETEQYRAQVRKLSADFSGRALVLARNESEL